MASEGAPLWRLTLPAPRAERVVHSLSLHQSGVEKDPESMISSALHRSEHDPLVPGTGFRSLAHASMY